MSHQVDESSNLVFLSTSERKRPIPWIKKPSRRVIIRIFYVEVANPQTPNLQSATVGWGKRMQPIPTVDGSEILRAPVEVGSHQQYHKPSVILTVQLDFWMHFSPPSHCTPQAAVRYHVETVLKVVAEKLPSKSWPANIELMGFNEKFVKVWKVHKNTLKIMGATIYNTCHDIPSCWSVDPYSWLLLIPI